MSSEAPADDSKKKASKQHVTIAGAVAGLVSRFVIAPLDVVKIRLQLQHHSPTHHPSIATILRPSSLSASSSTSHVIIKPILSSTISATASLTGSSLSSSSSTATSPRYTGILPSLRTIIHQEGLRALWKGNLPAELLYLLYGSSQFLSFRLVSGHLTTTFPSTPTPAINFISGALAGAAATTATYPLDLLRTRFASQGADIRVYQSFIGSIAHIYRHEGLHGYFRGLGAGVAQIVPYMGLFFTVYEPTRSTLRSLSALTTSKSSWPDAAAGTFAAVVAKTGVFPLDLIRKRLQVQGPTRELYVHKNIPVYTGVAQAARLIIAREGVRGLYKGLTVSLLKAAPASAVTMWTFEQTMALLKWGEDRGGFFRSPAGN